MKKAIIDPDLYAYRSFFDHEWARTIFEISEGTKLGRAVFDLCTFWKGAANTHVLPWIMMQRVGAFASGFVGAHEHDPLGVKLITALKERLVAEMAGSLRNMQRKALQEVIDRIYQQMRTALDNEPFTYDVRGEWVQLLENDELRLSLWGSQRLCYAALYYGYENFVARCYKLATSQSKYKIQPKEFKRDFELTFGPQLLDHCWTQTGVNVARVVRHALVHNGGHVTDDFRKCNPPFCVVDDEIQILASDTASLFNLLKTPALQLTRATVRILTA